MVSFCVVLLVSVALQQSEQARSIYDQEIRPNERKILFYDLRTRVARRGPPYAAKRLSLCGRNGNSIKPW